MIKSYLPFNSSRFFQGCILFHIMSSISAPARFIRWHYIQTFLNARIDALLPPCILPIRSSYIQYCQYFPFFQSKSCWKVVFPCGSKSTVSTSALLQPGRPTNWSRLSSSDTTLLICNCNNTSHTSILSAGQLLIISFNIAIYIQNFSET